MSKDENDRDTVSGRILKLVHNLLQTPDGLALYRRIEAGYMRCQTLHHRVDREFLAYLDRTLLQYIEEDSAEPATRMVAKLIQRRMAGAADDLADPELESLSDDPATRALLGRLTSLEEEAREEDWARLDPVQAQALKVPGHNLTRQRRDLERVQQSAEDKIRASIGSTTDFLSNLKTVRSAMAEADNTDTLDGLRQVLLGAIDEIISWQNRLGEQLHETTDSLRLIRADNVHLHREIIKVRQLTQMDEYTGLPNRVAFMRQLRAELQRARRHDLPLTVCAITIDGLAELQAEYGDELADEVLQIYVEQVITRFRGYDLAARLGPSLFGVLFAGTDVDGAIRALAEAQHRAGRQALVLNGQESQLPTFSSGVAQSAEEEEPEVLLERAEAVLKQSIGSKRLEVAPLPGATARDNSGAEDTSLH